MKSGKSSTCNSIVGRKGVFPFAPGTEPCTKDFKVEFYQRESIHIVDTPPLDDNSDLQKINDDLKKTFTFTNLTYGIVIPIGRFTTEERSVFLDLFQPNIFEKKPFIIFTRERDLDETENISNSLQQWIHSCPTLESVITTNSLKYFSIENKATDSKKKQAKEILEAAKSPDVVKFVAKLPIEISIRKPSSKNDLPELDFPMTSTDEPEHNRRSLVKTPKTPKIAVDQELLKQYFGKSGEEFYVKMFKQQYETELFTFI